MAVGTLEAKHTQKLMGRLFGEFTMQLVGSCPLMPYESPMFRSPRLFLPPVMQLRIQYSGWGKIEMSFSVTILYS